MRIVAVISFLFIFSFSSCKKEDKGIDSNTPTIQLQSVSSTSVKEGESLTLTVQYVDGDGDLGVNSSSQDNLFLTDLRVNVTYGYRISQLAPSSSGPIIKGNINIVLNSTAITDGSSSQRVNYSIYVKDRAGHKSNTIITAGITITK